MAGRLIDHCAHGFRIKYNCPTCYPNDPREETPAMGKTEKHEKLVASLPTNEERMRSGDWGEPRDGYIRAGNVNTGDTILWDGHPSRVEAVGWPTEDFATLDLYLKNAKTADPGWYREISPFSELRIYHKVEPVEQKPPTLFLIKTTNTVPHTEARSIVIASANSKVARDYLAEVFDDKRFHDVEYYEAWILGTSTREDGEKTPRIINDTGTKAAPDVETAQILAEIRTDSEWMVNELRKYAGFRPNSSMTAFQQAIAVIDDLSSQLTLLNTTSHTRRMQRDRARKQADK
jgi:hypothetical protein